ncbi:MAG: hypothetical protein WCT25_01100 [Candidatus Paceibacterota bacterium]
MKLRKAVRAVIISGSAMVIAIIFARQGGISIEGAVGFSALTVAICYEVSFEIDPSKP